MAKKIRTSSLPTQTIAYLVILGGGILLFILLIIMPAQKKSEALDFQIENIRTRIEEQKILTPVYQNLLKKVQLDPPEGVEIKPKEKLKSGQAENLAQEFQAMAKASRLQLVEFSPDVDSLVRNSGFLQVNLMLKGEFINLHPFLMDICQLPYMEVIEKIRIESAEDAKEIQLRIWLAHE
jgi:hypothetical protein